MAQILVRGLEDDMKEKLAKRARKHGRSMVAEVREILRNALREEDRTPTALGTRISRRFADCGFEEGEIQELRGNPARPADLD